MKAAFDTASCSGLRRCSGLIFFALWLLLTGCAQSSSGQEIPQRDHLAGLLIPTCNPLDFGTVRQGEQKKIAVRFRNPCNTSVNIDSIQSSCDCFRIDFQSMVVPPGGNVQAIAVLDLGADRDFVGKLTLNATGLSPAKAEGIVFFIEASVEVKPQSSLKTS